MRLREMMQRLQYLLRRQRFEDDVAEEMAFHRAMKEQEFEEDGHQPADAVIAARRSMGSIALAQDRVRDLWCPGWLQGIGQDCRLALRKLLVTKTVTAVAVLSLALGIGANTAMFSLVSSLLLRPLPIVAPERLVTVSSVTADHGGFPADWTYPVWEEIHRRTRLFDGAVAWSRSRFNLAPGGQAQFVTGLWVNGSFFSTLGVPPLLGGSFTDADDARGGRADGAVVMISYSFWQQRFGGAPDVVGRTLTLDKLPFKIVGVTPRSFFGLEVGETFDVVVPWGEEPLLHGQESCVDGRGNNCWMRIMARLRPGQTHQAATTALRAAQREIWDATISRSLRPEYREKYLAESFELLPASTGTSYLRQLYTRPLVALMVVVALVLLIACANVANVMLARGIARRPELSVRLALGASRWRLVRQLLIETLALAGTATAFGFGIAAWGSRLVAAELSTRPWDTVFLDLSIDWRVLLFTMGVAIATALLFGVAPAFLASRVAPIDAIKEQGRGASGDALGKLASGLVVAQVVVSIVLVVAAGLFVRTFTSLATRSLGFDRNQVLLVNIDAPQIAPAQRVAVYDHIRETVRSVPGVGAVAVSMVTPVGGMGLGPHMEVSGGVPVQGNMYGNNGVTNVVTPNWFETFGTPLLAGRDFTDRDRGGTPLVAIVNQTLAQKFLNGANPIGHTITLGTPGRAVTMDIVGVVADAVYTSVREPVPATVYTPLSQFYLSPNLLKSVSLSVRSRTGSPSALRSAVAAAIGRVDPDVSLTFRVLADQVNASLRQERLVATLSGFFGVLALLLAGLGLYGVTAYAVTRRRSEFGIRMALGAAPSGIVRLVLLRVALLVGAGVIVGTAVSLWASTYVASLLYGLAPHDPETLVGAALILAAVATVASWMPARRASRTDPAIALRCD